MAKKKAKPAKRATSRHRPATSRKPTPSKKAQTAPAKRPARTSTKTPKARSGAARSAAGAPAGPPMPPVRAELIVRQGFVIDATAKRHAAIPEVLILGNREGLRYLADVFAFLAEQAVKNKSEDPFAAIQVGRNEHPVNTRLSDGIEFRFSFVSDANRAATFKRHGVTMKSREQGSLFGRYQDVASTQYQSIARRIGAPPPSPDSESKGG